MTTGTASWVSLAELARKRGVSREAVRRMVKRAERASGRRYVSTRLAHDKSGRLRRLKGVAANVLMANIRDRDGYTPEAPEVAELRRQIENLTDIIYRMKDAERERQRNR